MQEEGINTDSIALTGDFRTEGTARAMVTAYLKQNRPFIEDIELLHIERPFAVPLGKTDQYFYVGRLDKVIRRKKRVYEIEHKTSSAYLKGGPFRSTFTESFSPNSQIDGYMFAGHLMYGDEFKAIWIDAALVHKTIHNGFRFIPIERQYAMLDQWLSGAKYWAELINCELAVVAKLRSEGIAQEAKYLSPFPLNTESCMQYYGCAYRDTCRFTPNPETLTEPPKGFKEERWEPFDELGLAEIGMKEEPT